VSRFWPGSRCRRARAAAKARALSGERPTHPTSRRSRLRSPSSLETSKVEKKFSFILLALLQKKLFNLFQLINLRKAHSLQQLLITLLTQNLTQVFRLKQNDGRQMIATFAFLTVFVHRIRKPFWLAASNLFNLSDLIFFVNKKTFKVIILGSLVFLNKWD
jgi:hypothetical protein